MYIFYCTDFLLCDKVFEKFNQVSFELVDLQVNGLIGTAFNLDPSEHIE
jgi:hypothetical protein